MNKYFDVYLCVMIILVFCVACSSVKQPSIPNASTNNTVLTTISIPSSSGNSKSNIIRETTSILSATSTTNTSSSQSIEATKQEMDAQNEAQQFLNSVEKVVSANKSNSFQEMQLSTAMLGDFNSSNPKIIAEWLDLLSQVRVSIAPFEFYFGEHNYTLTFISDTQELHIGSIGSGHIYLPESLEKKIMLRIDNYDELRSQFLELEKKMGVRSE